MRRPFQRLQQLPDIVIGEPARQPHLPGRDHKGLLRRLFRRHQSPPKEVIDDLLERSPGFTALFIQETRHIIVEGQGSTHIVMLIVEAS